MRFIVPLSLPPALYLHVLRDFCLLIPSQISVTLSHTSANVAAILSPCDRRKARRENKGGLAPPSWDHRSTVEEGHFPQAIRCHYSCYCHCHHDLSSGLRNRRMQKRKEKMGYFHTLSVCYEFFFLLL